MPALFIRLPARMKKGTASSGKLSMPLTIRWMTTKGGRVLSLRVMYSSAEPAMAMATGRPLAMSARKMIFSMIDSSVVLHGGLGAFQHAVAAPPMRAHDQHRAHGHRGEACQAGGVHPVHRQV